MNNNDMNPDQPGRASLGSVAVARRLRSRVVHSREAGLGFVLLVLIVGLSLATPHFFTASNLAIVARQISLVAIIAIGVMFVILLADIDLSIGSIVALSSVLTGVSLVNWGLPVFLGILVGLATGAFVGFLNGSLVTKTGVPSFIVTLGMMGVARGAALVITKGSSISGLPSSYLSLGQGFVFGIPNPVWILLIVAIIAHLFLSRTTTGLHIYFIGSNPQAALLSGINVTRVKVLCFTLAGSLAALEAVIETSRMSTAQPAAGVGYELIAIGAVIIGGASLFGGEGTILGTILGATLLGLMTNGLILLGISTYWQTIFSGSIIILAVALDVWRRKRK